MFYGTHNICIVVLISNMKMENISYNIVSLTKHSYGFEHCYELFPFQCN